MTVFTTEISASADDRSETDNGSMQTTSNTSLNANGSNTYIGLRFQNVTVPPGSTINSAYVHLWPSGVAYDDPNLEIYGEAAASSADFSALGSYLISGRTFTTESTSWVETGLGTGGSSSPDIANVIEEIIGVTGWASGNPLTIILAGNSGSALRCRSYDYGSLIPYIYIDYTEAGGGGQAPRSMYYMRNILNSG